MPIYDIYQGLAMFTMVILRFMIAVAGMRYTTKQN